MKTASVCPVCLSRISAELQVEGEEVYMVKACNEHGVFRTLIWKGEPGVEKWLSGWAQPEDSTLHEAEEENCPYDCGICSNHRQQSCCVLLEVTQSCNLNCPVCFASAGQREQQDPSLAQIIGWYKMLMDRGGPYNIQLSGGEPTLRDDLPEIIQAGKRMGFDFFQVNTNGIRLAEEPDYCKKMAQAGLDCAFLQFDSLTAEGYTALRGIDLLEKKIKAIENCSENGIGVVLVPTVVPGVNEGELGAIINFAATYMPAVRGVHFQPVSHFGRYPKTFSDRRLTLPQVLKMIEEQTQGQIPVSAFMPPSSEHPLCSFNGKFVLNKNGKFKEVTEFGKSQSCCCSGGKSAAQGARKYVARQWSAPERSHSKKKALKTVDRSRGDLSSLDAFLEQSKYTLTLSGMVFQDAWNLDLNRLKQCHIHVVSQKGDLIPFCAYNLTAVDGKSLYR